MKKILVQLMLLLVAASLIAAKSNKQIDYVYYEHTTISKIEFLSGNKIKFEEKDPTAEDSDSINKIVILKLDNKIKERDIVDKLRLYDDGSYPVVTLKGLVTKGNEVYHITSKEVQSNFIVKEVSVREGSNVKER